MPRKKSPQAVKPSRKDGAYPPVVLPLSYDGFGINQSDKYAARLLTLNVPPVHGLTPQQNEARRKEVAALIVRAVNAHERAVDSLSYVDFCADGISDKGNDDETVSITMTVRGLRDLRVALRAAQEEV